MEIRTKILGLGSYVPDRVVTNEEIPFLDDQHVRQDTQQTETNDAWIQQRTGIKERRYVPNDGTCATSDLALEAAKRAIADAGLQPSDIDCIILGTLSPDIHFPGTAVLVQKKLGIDARRAARASTSASSARRSSTACRWPTRSSAPACTSASC